MKKRLLSLILSFAICLSLFSAVGVVAATNENIVSIKAFATYEDAVALTNQITGVEKDSEFYVALTFDQFKYVHTLKATLGFDADMVKPVTFDNGDFVELPVDEGQNIIEREIPMNETDGTNGVEQFEHEIDYILLEKTAGTGIPKIGKSGKYLYTLMWSTGGTDVVDILTETVMAVFRFKAVAEGNAIFNIPYKPLNSTQTTGFDRRNPVGIEANYNDGEYDDNYTYQKGTVFVNDLDLTITTRSLETPENVQLNGRNVTWDAVTDAGSYTVNVSVTNVEGTSNKEFTSNTNSFTIPANQVEYGKISVTVKANSNIADVNDSKPSAPAVNGAIYKELSAPANVRWDGQSVVWDAVPAATKYSVTLTLNGEAVTGYPKTVTETTVDVSADMETPDIGSNSYVVSITAVGNPDYTTNDYATSLSTPVKFYGNVKSVISPVWSNKTTASWTANDDAANVKEYLVTLIKDGAEIKQVTTTNTSVDLAQYMTESGRYTFGVTAIGKTVADGTYGDSTTPTSGEMIVSTPLSPVTSITWNDRVITWTDENKGTQRGYEIVLYEKLEGETEFSAKGTPIIYTGTTKEYNLDPTNLITVGDYKVSIKVLGDNVFHTDSETAFESDVKTFTARLAEPVDATWSAEKTASWTAGDANAVTYVVHLLYNGVYTGVEKVASTTSVVFEEADMKLPGEYTFTVQAKAPGYSPSKETLSNNSQTVNVTRTGNVHIEIFKDAECTAAPTEIKVGQEFYVAISVESIGDIDSISVPFSFDSRYVKVVDVNDAVMQDVTLTREEVANGEKGIILGSVLKDKISSIIYQTPYPYINNTDGLVMISAYTGVAKNISAKETIAIIKMQAVSMSESDNVELGFAVANDDDKAYDSSALSGIEFAKLGDLVFANMPSTYPVKIEIKKGAIDPMAAPVWSDTTLTWVKADGEHVVGYEIDLIKDGGSVEVISVNDPSATSLNVLDKIGNYGYGVYTAKIRAIGDGIGADSSDWSPESEGYVFKRRNNNGGSSRPSTPVTPVDPKPPVDEKPEFTDIEGHWAENDIKELVDLGIVAGYGDNTFRPDLGITRAEFTRLMVTSLGLDINADKHEYYEDTESHWAKDYIAVGTEMGIVYGIGDNLFDPDRIITREQVAAIIYRIAEEVEVEVSDFIDREEVSEYAQPAVDYVAKHGIMIGFHDNSFRGQEYTTRAQMATVVLRLIKADFFETTKLATVLAK